MYMKQSLCSKPAIYARSIEQYRSLKAKIFDIKTEYCWVKYIESSKYAYESGYEVFLNFSTISIQFAKNKNVNLLFDSNYQSYREMDRMGDTMY